MNTISKEEYTRLVDLFARFEVWRNGRNSYPADSVPDDVRITNEQRSQIEVYEFVNNPPKKYFLYVNPEKRIVTTWMGDILGNITFLGLPYKCPAFGWPSTRQNLTFRGINGKNYTGIFYKSSGDYARVKMIKG